MLQRESLKHSAIKGGRLLRERAACELVFRFAKVSVCYTFVKTNVENHLPHMECADYFEILFRDLV